MENKFRYKAWANQELLELVKQINKDEQPDQWTTAIRLLNHTLVVDKIFIAHLQGVAHSFSATNTPETPTLAQLKQRIEETDAWLISYVQELSPTSLKEEVEFTFTDGDSGRMTREEILDHLIIHGAYHRGNVGMLLTECGLNRPADIFTRFLHMPEQV
ncbi:DinB family protein [Litoribrevibacter albus]|uniref:DNA damage-inducible protein DinB n=1 Tax=Litoribrevibacter albus TaxID=1473156 RepID=A0AA37SEF9_9GAMM|nr:DinB family protein [Litoribrevibacter albus]GLQ33578.1 DNA damage-inducible protein DinB [Litoribrevibacter albus]